MLHRLSAWILALDPFWRDIIKMVLDKLLLGGVAAWIVYLFAKALEKQKARSTATAKRVELRDAAITTAWQALRKLEIELDRAGQELSNAILPGPLTAVAFHRLPGELNEIIDDAQSKSIETINGMRPRLPPDLFKTFVALYSARVDLIRAQQS